MHLLRKEFWHGQHVLQRYCTPPMARHFRGAEKDRCNFRPISPADIDKHVRNPCAASFPVTTVLCVPTLSAPTTTRQVERVFTLSISELLDPSFRATDDLGPRGKLPAFTAGPSRVWGLTAVITDGVLRNGIVPSLTQATNTVAASAEGDGGGGGARQNDAPRNRSGKGPGGSSL